MAKVGYTGTVYGDPQALALAAEQNVNASADAVVVGANTTLGVGGVTTEEIALQQQQARENLQRIKENNMNAFDHTLRGITKTGIAVLNYPSDLLTNVYNNAIGVATGEVMEGNKAWNDLTPEQQAAEKQRRQDLFWSGTQLGSLINSTFQYITGQTEQLDTGSDWFLTEDSDIVQKQQAVQKTVAGWDSPDEYGDRPNIGTTTASQLLNLEKGSAAYNATSFIADASLIAFDLFLGTKALGKLDQVYDITKGMLTGERKAVAKGSEAAKITSEARRAKEDIKVLQAEQQLKTVRENVAKRFGQDVVDDIEDVSRKALEGGADYSETVFAQLLKYGEFIDNVKSTDGATLRAKALDDSVAFNTAEEVARLNKIDEVIDSSERGKLASEMSFYGKERDKINAINANQKNIDDINVKIQQLEEAKKVDGADITAIDEQIVNFANTRNRYLQNAEIIKAARIGDEKLTADTLYNLARSIEETVEGGRVLNVAPLENSVNAAKANVDKWTAATAAAKAEVRVAKKELTAAKKTGNAKVIKEAEAKVVKAENKVARSTERIARHKKNYDAQVKNLEYRIKNNERLNAARAARESVVKEALLYKNLDTLQSVTRDVRGGIEAQAVAKAEAIRTAYNIAGEPIDDYASAINFLDDVIGLRRGANGEVALNVEEALNWATRGGIKTIVESIRSINTVDPAEAASRIFNLTRGKFDIETVRLLANTTDDKEIMAILMEAMTQTKTGFNIGKLSLLKRGARVYTKNGELVPFENLNKASTAIGEGFDRLLIWGYERRMTNTPWSYNFDTRDANSMVNALNDMIEFSVGTFGIPTGAVRSMKNTINKLGSKYLGKEPSFTGVEGAVWRSFKNKYVSKMINARTADERKKIFEEAQLDMARLSGEHAGLHLIKAEPKIIKGKEVPQTQLDVFVDAFRRSVAYKNDMIARMAKLKTSSTVKNVQEVITDLGLKGEIPDDAIIYGEFLNHTVGMINPYEMRKMITTGKTIDQLYNAKGITVNVNGVEKVLSGKVLRKAIFKLTSDIYDRFFRRAMLFRVGYVVRNVLETQIRMYLKGHPNTLSNPLLYFSLSGARKPNKETLNIIKRSLDNAQLDARGLPFVDELAEDAALRAEFEQTEFQKINNRGTMLDTGYYDDPAKGQRIGFEYVTATEGARYAEGIATYTYRMASNQINRDVLSAVTGQGLRNDIWEWAVKNGFDKGRTYDDIVTEFYWSGPGYEKITELARAGGGRYSAIFSTRDNLYQYMFGNTNISIKQRWNAFTDNFDQNIIDEIFSDNFVKGKSYRETLKRIKELQQGLIKKAKDNPSQAVIQKVPVEQYVEGTRRAADQSEWFVTEMFTAISDNMFKFSAWGEKTFATLPEFRYAYWDYMSTAVMTLSKEEAAKVLKTAEETLSTTTSVWARDTLKSLRANAKNAEGSGVLTIDDLHNTASRVAGKKVGELFYDANKRNAVGHALRFISPFGQAWANSMMVWGKLAAQNLGKVYVAEQFLKSLESKGSAWITDPFDQDDVDQPFIYKDPATQKKVFGIPLVGELGGLLASAVTGQNMTGSYGSTIDVGSLNLIMQNGFAPGFGPIIQIAENALSGNETYRRIMPDELRSIINPYSRDPNQAFNILGTVTPAWFQELTAGFLFPERRNKYTTGAMLTLMQANPEKYLDDEGTLDSAGQMRLVKDAEAMANGLAVARGITQFFAPGATKLEAKFKDDDGRYMLASVVSDEYFTYLKQGYDQKEAMAKLVDAYGTDAALTMITANRLGYTPTDDAWELYKDNPDLFNEYSTVLPLIYVGGGYSVSLANYMSTGDKRLSVNEQALQINRLLKDAKEAQIDIKLSKGQLDAYTYEEELNKLSEAYTGAPMPQVSTSYRESVIEDLTDAMEDPTLASTPAGQAIKIYLENRSYVVGLGVGIDAKKQAGNRQALFELGTQLASENPEFAVAWFKVLRSEVKPQDVK